MITGFNTDIAYNGTTYHIQTEDKGESNPIIESLVYVRGAILAAKRTSYAKELRNGLLEEQLQAMLEKQHRTILAVIKAGRIQELVEKLNKQQRSENEASELPVPPAILAKPSIATSLPTQPQVSMPTSPVAQQEFSEPLPRSVEPPSTTLPTAMPGYRTSGSLDIGISKGDSQPLFAEFDLDKIIFDYLQTDAHEEKLEIHLRGSTDFYAGEVVILQIEVSRGGIQPLPSVPVIVKIIGTAFKPQIYSGRTGPDGVAIMPVTLPNFTAGSAAIVVQSSSEVGEAEIKQLIRRR
ncbi:MAG: hypothetical protein AB1489_00450 [Acidobacteriota bacterium]